MYVNLLLMTRTVTSIFIFSARHRTDNKMLVQLCGNDGKNEIEQAALVTGDLKLSQNSPKDYNRERDLRL